MFEAHHGVDTGGYLYIVLPSINKFFWSLYVDYAKKGKRKVVHYVHRSNTRVVYAYGSDCRHNISMGFLWFLFVLQNDQKLSSLENLVFINGQMNNSMMTKTMSWPINDIVSISKVSQPFFAFWLIEALVKIWLHLKI